MGYMMNNKTKAIYCDIDGVVTHKFAVPNYDHFGEPNEKMLPVLRCWDKSLQLYSSLVDGQWGKKR